MARKIGGLGKEAEKLKGPTSDSHAFKTRFIDVVMGVEAIDFGFGIGEVMMPTSSLKNLQQQSEIRHTFNGWLDSIHKTRSNEGNEVRISPKPIFEPLENDDAS